MLFLFHEGKCVRKKCMKKEDKGEKSKKGMGMASQSRMSGQKVEDKKF